MTLILGAHLGDGVGLVGDTRVTVTYSDGHLEHFDDCQKIYNLIGCLVGVAGDLKAAHLTIAEIISRSLYDLSPSEAVHRCAQADWIESELKKAHSAVVREQRDLTSRRFNLILANEDVTVARPKTVVPENRGGGFILDNSISLRARMLRRGGESRCSVISAAFPDCALRSLTPGEVIYVGSGDYIDEVVQEDIAVIPPGATAKHAWQRFSMLMGNYKTSQSKFPDDTFNLIEHALFMGDGVLESMFTTFNAWPKNGVPQNSYSWGDMSDWQQEWGDKMFGESITYSTGFDPDILNCSIYDYKLERTLRLRMIANVLQDLGAQYETAHG